MQNIRASLKDWTAAMPMCMNIMIQADMMRYGRGKNNAIMGTSITSATIVEAARKDNTHGRSRTRSVRRGSNGGIDLEDR